MTTMFSEPAPGATTCLRSSLFSRNNLLLAAGLSLAGLGLAAGLAFRSAPVVDPATTSAEMTRASLAANENLVERSGTPVPARLSAPPAGLVATATRAAPETLVAQAPSSATKPAPVCGHCGVVQSVRAVKKKGKGTGVGAVAGGVVGGAVGNQFGHGSGRAAMTVLGAVGGGLAGNEIEKRSRSVTVYQVQVKMDDGSVRSFEQATALAVGARVTVDGGKLRLARSRAPATHAHSPA
jgi:outer membrane lipoprotein SlyB